MKQVSTERKVPSGGLVHRRHGAHVRTVRIFTVVYRGGAMSTIFALQRCICLLAGATELCAKARERVSCKAASFAVLASSGGVI